MKSNLISRSFTRLFFLSFQLHLGEHLNISLKRGFWDCAVISCRKSARQSWKLRRKSNKMTLNLFLWVCIWCVYIYFFLSLSQMVVTPNLPNLIRLEKISHSLWIALNWLNWVDFVCLFFIEAERVWGFHQANESLGIFPPTPPQFVVNWLCFSSLIIS